MFKSFGLLIATAFMMGVFSGTAVVAADSATWKKEVIKKIRKSHIYPRTARTREIEGKALVRLMIAKDGTVTGHEIVKPSGETILDQVIPKIVERLNPLPALPDGKEDLKMVIPLTWVLR